MPRLGYVITVNGQSASLPMDGIQPRFRVGPGQQLLITVALTVPRHVTLSQLWLGISAGSWGLGPKGPVGMNPVLRHVRQPLSAGPHTFGLRWRIPDDQRRASRLFLIAVWWASAPSAGVAQGIARLAVD